MSEMDLQIDRKLSRAMPRCWPAFFERFGRLTAVQRKAIPFILAGEDVLVGAPTASGKTEAACAPMLERHLGSQERRTILYVCPTRALVNDLHERLAGPGGRLGVEVVRRTGDHATRINKPVDVLITTPESFDSLLCRGRRAENGHVLARVASVVLDEIHVLFGTPRGEQIRWLLERLRRVRQQAERREWSIDSALQVVALSATVVDDEAVCRNYLRGGRSIAVGGARPIESVRGEANQLTAEDALPAYVRSLSTAEKILVFCNTRLRVDELSAKLRHTLAKFNYRVYAHHGSLSQPKREAAEAAARTASKIVLVATSTLELGIDIGDVDLVVLDSPAPDMPSLLQRMGRGNRRTTVTRVMTCAGAIEEIIIHSAMLEAARDGWSGPAEHGPSFAVIRQQLASYIFQAPGRARQRRTLEAFLGCVGPEAVGIRILDHITAEGDLIEDRDGIRLGEDWLDRAADGRVHCNIEALPGETVVDAGSGSAIAENVRFKGGRGMRIGGEFLEVKRWRDRKIEVQRVTNAGKAIGEWGYTSRSWFRGSGQPQAVRRYLGLSENEWPSVVDGASMKVFHFGGARRRAVIELIMANVSEDVAGFSVNEWFLSFCPGQEVREIMQQAGQGILEIAATDRVDSLERTLARPNANKSLPLDVRVHEVTAWLQIDRELERIRASVWCEVEDPVTRTVLRAFA